MSDSTAPTADPGVQATPARRARRRPVNREEAAARRDEVAEAMKAKLDAAIAGLDTEERWIEVLDTFAQFGAKYSLGNQLLILIGCEERGFKPTFVQSFNAWKAQAKHDPTVCKGKSLKFCGCDLNVPKKRDDADPDVPFGLPIWAPVTRKLSAKECDERESAGGKKIPRDPQGRSRDKLLVGFKPTYVFDVAQLKRPLEAEIPPPIAVRRRIKVQGVQPELLTGDDTTGALPDLIALIEAAGLKFEYVHPTTLGDANGRTNGKWVRVRNDVSDAQKFKTGVHEYAHNKLGHVEPGFDYVLHRGRAETEAESVAYVVCGALGLDTGAYSAPYVASWAGGDPQVMQDAAKNVLRVAKEILAALDPNDPPAAEAEQTAELAEAA